MNENPGLPRYPSIHTGRWFDQDKCQQAKSIKVEKNNDIDQGCWSSLQSILETNSIKVPS